MKKSAQKNLFFASLRLCGKNLALILIFCIFFTACKSENSTTKIEAQPTKSEISTREIIDDLGRRVKIPGKVERVVSLAPNLTEIVFAVGAGDKLIGVTTFCNYPEEAKKIQKIGDTMSPNIENIVALKPQIVLISTAAQIETFTKVLDEQSIAYFVTNPQNLDGIYKSVGAIGELFGRTDRAEEIVTGLKKRVANIESRVASEKSVQTFLQISKEPLYTIGKESFMTDLIKRAGGISVTESVETAYPKLSKETALVLNPDAIILSESDDNNAPNDVFKNSPAVKNGKVFKINADIISRPAPRIVDAMEQIARALHPDRME